ncbi:helix-turn-helix domain-containing protein [Aliarcobacter cryaerophilus]|uniref:helix-turn-helix domain-containing protein n=1 Tax=Aliarcobacter cryaerophilus TaxID=28198 RepID=UPI0011DFB54D|nr:helix-turn-helix domain-containing protein [Aliarcobacter cryaerophilus]
MDNVDDVLKKLYDYYKVSGVNELSLKLGVSPQNISNWKTRNSINPLKTIIRQNGIYEKIFGESILRNASDLVDRLMEYYDVTTISELAEKINIGQQAISKWRKNNSIEAIKKKSKELNLYNYLFDDFEVDLFQSSEYDYYTNHDKAKILKKQCKKYGVKLETVDIKNKRLLFLIQELDKFANEEEIKKIENILKDLYLNLEPDKPYLPKFSEIEEDWIKNQMKENLEKAINKFVEENS